MACLSEYCGDFCDVLCSVSGLIQSQGESDVRRGVGVGPHKVVNGRGLGGGPNVVATWGTGLVGGGGGGRWRNQSWVVQNTNR